MHHRIIMIFDIEIGEREKYTYNFYENFIIQSELIVNLASSNGEIKDGIIIILIVNKELQLKKSG